MFLVYNMIHYAIWFIILVMLNKQYKTIRLTTNSSISVYKTEKDFDLNGNIYEFY